MTIHIKSGINPDSCVITHKKTGAEITNVTKVQIVMTPRNLNQAVLTFDMVELDIEAECDLPPMDGEEHF